jgi:3-phosphoshikimate 1-carboxyvinyltransferase
MDIRIDRAEKLQGTLRMPGDKSIAHRALILGAMARGEQVIDGLPDSEDVRSTAECLRALGCSIECEDDRVVVASGRWIPGQDLYAGNSGTTARLLSGLIAGLGLNCWIDGDASLRTRPMARVVNPLARMGATVRIRPGGRLPMQIGGGNLSGITFRPPVASAQVKSAVLIAGLHAQGCTTVVEATPTRDHTENLLTAMGVPVERKNGVVSVPGGARLGGLRVTVPGDVSSAVFFAVVASLIPGSEIRLAGTGINPTRTGALEVLRDMGAQLDLENVRDNAGEPVGDIIVRSAGLRGVDIEGAMIPRLIDELPVLAVAATQAEGVTTVRGAGELRHKESDRIRTMVENLRRLGADIEEEEDGFVIHGPCALSGARVSSFGDHRVAMSMAVAGLIADGGVVVENAEAASVSYPGFFEDVQKLTRR